MNLTSFQEMNLTPFQVKMNLAPFCSNAHQSRRYWPCDIPTRAKPPPDDKLLFGSKSLADFLRHVSSRCNDRRSLLEILQPRQLDTCEVIGLQFTQTGRVTPSHSANLQLNIIDIQCFVQ